MPIKGDFHHKVLRPIYKEQPQPQPLVLISQCP